MPYRYGFLFHVDGGQHFLPQLAEFRWDFASLRTHAPTPSVMELGNKRTLFLLLPAGRLYTKSSWSQYVLQGTWYRSTLA